MKHKIVNFNADRISGWFYDPAAGETKSVLEVLVDGERATTLTCNVFRDELDSEEFPNRNIGFLGTLPPQFWTGDTFSVSLVHPQSGTVLVEQSMESTDRRLAETEGLSADFQLTERGELAGWASREGEHITVRIHIDGQHIETARANQDRIRWSAKQITVPVPFGYAYSFQVPPEYFDDGDHRVQLSLDHASGEVPVLDETLNFPTSYRETAAAEQERVQSAKPDWSSRWRKQAKVREDVQFQDITITARYAAVTLTGETRHRRLTLRLGNRVVPLHAVAGAPEDRQDDDALHGRQRYASVIPASKSFAGSLSLFTEGAEVEDTYEIRLGDQFGNRPTGLPPQIVEDTVGELRLSPTSLDAGVFDGWAFHTADLTSAPVEIVLTRISDDGVAELARVPAVERNRQTRQRYGVGPAGYTIPLPEAALTRRTSHLRLEAVHASDTRTLWEDTAFYPTNQFLHTQALTTTSSSKALDLLMRARAAGRKNFVEAFLGTYKYASSKVKLEDLERALAPKVQTPAKELEPASGAIWYWVKELRGNPGRIHWFIQNAIRNRLGDARDVLAYCATKANYDFTQVHGILESYRAPLFREQAATLIRTAHWGAGMLSLARLLYAVPRDETDYLDALTLYRMVESWRGLEYITGTDRAFYGDLLRWRGDSENSARVLQAEDSDPEQDYSQNLLSLNAINPQSTGHSGHATAWLTGLNELLEAGGVTPIGLNGGDVSFYSLTSDLPKVSSHNGRDPLISVIMPIYEPSRATDIAVDSLLKQTWSNIEIIMVDDCSPKVDEEGNPTPYRQQLEELSARDSRIRLVFNETNRGAYAARNDGLDLAKGDFITIADKDDWHHPQQFEIEVQHLLEDSELVAVETNWSRVDQDLMLVLRSATGRVAYPSMPSLMFRRDPVLNDLGYWDTVRKSGDSEFKSRIENYYGIKLKPVVQAPLAFALMEGANLTKDDMGVGYLAPDRRSYLRAYKRWHREIREDEGSPYMPKAPDDRRFVAPPMYLPGYDKDLPLNYDVVFASEFGFVAGNSTSLFTEISVCLEAGLKVAVIPFQNGLIPSAAKRQFNRKIDDLVLTGQVDRISLETVAETRLLIVRWPTALQLVQDAPAGLIPERAVVVANHPPFEPGGRRSYDIGVVTRNVERLFGTRPTWAGQSEQITAMLEPLLPPSDVENFSWKGIISAEGKPRRSPDFSSVPTIGRHGRDDPAKWPSDRDTFRKVYPTDGSRNVCILGGTKVPTKLGYLPRDAKNWEVYAFNEITVDEYLTDKLDFFVYFHSDGWLEAFGMVTLEAMTYGVVCILPRHFQPVFREAAIYAAPDDVQNVIAELWLDPDGYRAQQQRALDWVHAECTPGAYLRRLEGLGVFPAALPTRVDYTR